MQLMLTKRVGNTPYHFTFEGEDLFEVIEESEKVSFDAIPECGCCHSSNLKLISQVTKEQEFKYVKVLCLDCRATLTFGQTKKGHQYYPRKDEQHEFRWEENPKMIKEKHT